MQLPLSIASVHWHNSGDSLKYGGYFCLTSGLKSSECHEHMRIMLIL